MRFTPVKITTRWCLRNSGGQLIFFYEYLLLRYALTLMLFLLSAGNMENLFQATPFKYSNPPQKKHKILF